MKLRILSPKILVLLNLTVEEFTCANWRCKFLENGRVTSMQTGYGENVFFASPEGEFLVKKVMSWEGVRREFGLR